MAAVGTALPGLLAGCGLKEDAGTPGAVPPSPTSDGAATLRDPKVQSNPSAPDYIKKRASDKSGPGQ